MKTPVLIAAVLLLCSGLCVADDSAISRIRAEYESIRNVLPGLTKESLGLATDGKADVYRDSKRNIHLIVVERFFESGRVVEEYYYAGGALIFSLYQHHRYNLPYHVTPESAKQSGVEPFDPTKTVISEDRYYFDKDKMIRWLNESRRDVKPGTKEFRQAEQDIAAASKEILVEFKHDR
jgi:hypothetical protein